MKDFKSFIIGFLTCTCMFLFMGQTSKISNSPIEVKIVGQPNLSSLGTMNVKIDGYSSIKVEPKTYSGFRIKE